VASSLQYTSLPTSPCAARESAYNDTPSHALAWKIFTPTRQLLCVAHENDVGVHTCGCHPRNPVVQHNVSRVKVQSKQRRAHGCSQVRAWCDEVRKGTPAMHTGCITQASSLLEFYGSMAGTHGCTQNADITAVPPWSARVQPCTVCLWK